MCVLLAKAVLTVFQFTEVLLEMIARHYTTEERKWKLIFVIESVKSFCRLYLFYKNRCSMLLLKQTSSVLDVFHRASANTLPDSVPHRDLLQLYARSGRGAHPHGSYVSVGLLPTSSVLVSTSLPRLRHIVAEVLYILRPSIYAGFRSVGGRWSPFLFSLFSDVLSRYLTRLDELSDAQREEMMRRLLLWSMYLFRSPLFDDFTKCVLFVMFDLIVEFLFLFCSAYLVVFL